MRIRKLPSLRFHIGAAMLRNTFTQLLKTWNFERTWDWDFPVFALAPTRLNKPDTAIDMLLHENKQNSYDLFVYNSWVYFPASLKAIIFVNPVNKYLR